MKLSCGIDYFLFLSGASSPNVPEKVTVGNIRYNSVDVQFTVTSIPYTKETYQVIYGTSQGKLIMKSEAIDGNSDLTTTNEVFTVRLLYLNQGTKYFFRVVAKNENNDMPSHTPTFNFTTPSLG